MISSTENREVKLTGMIILKIIIANGLKETNYSNKNY